MPTTGYSLIDHDGNVPSDIIVLNAQDAVGGLGHAAVLIGNEKTGFFLYSKNGTRPIPSSGPSNDAPDRGRYFRTLQDFANSRANFNDDGSIKYTRAYRIETSEQQDGEMMDAALKEVDTWYDVSGIFSGSCIDVCSSALAKAGLNPGAEDTYITVHGVSGKVTVYGKPVPNARYEAIVRNNPGVDVSKMIRPTPAAATTVRQQIATSKSLEHEADARRMAEFYRKQIEKSYYKR